MNRLFLAVVAAGCGLGAPLMAQAQTISGHGMGMGGRSQPAKPAEPPPPALPGAQTDNERVAPADKQNADMQPTDALFDAINRGDIGSARDALARGADMRGHNVLGMTPLELSVDLGRNNITFLLLSLRAGDSTAPTKAAALPSAGKQKPVAHAERHLASPVRATSAPQARPPAQFAGDGGTPIPSAGFLGFDAGRSGTVR